METITLSYTTAGGTLTRSKSLPDGSAPRIIAAAITRLAMPPASTNAQVFTALADEIFQVLKQTTLNVETAKARSTADATIVDIPLT